jgi:hypothetical protein
MQFDRVFESMPGAIDFGQQPSCATVRVPVKRLSTARVAWLNERALLQLGIDVANDKIRSVFSDWLIHHYGVASLANVELSNYQTGELRIFRADRYGGTGGAIHGGSGRCASFKHLSAKGIGKTPLIPKNADWNHSTGLAWLYEGIREAIASIVAGIELPYSAIPIIAVISTGQRSSRQPGADAAPTAIIIRPNFIRPAHLERSNYFGTLKMCNFDQSQDECSVNAWAHYLAELKLQDGGPVTSVEEMFRRIGFQIGAARVLKLWHGAFISSNCAISGASADFGSFSAVENWHNHIGQSGEVYGDEQSQIAIAMHSVLRCYTRQLRIAGEMKTLAECQDLAASSVSEGFEHTLRVAAGGFSGFDEIKFQALHRALALEFHRQNKYRTQSTIEVILERAFPKGLDSTQLLRLKHWWRSRAETLGPLGRVAASNKAEDFSKSANQAEITSFINLQVASSLRHIRTLSPGAVALAQLYYMGTLIIWYRSQLIEEIFLRIEAPRCKEKFFLLGKKMNVNNILEEKNVVITDGFVHIEIGTDSKDVCKAVSLSLFGQKIVVPDPTFVY